VISTRSGRVEGRRPQRVRPEPKHAPELAHLGLEALRDYRQELVAEETRVSYWRRILQARLDQVIGFDDHQALRRLRGVLNDHGQSSRRLALLPVVRTEDAAPLPDLAVLWETTPGGEGDQSSMVARLSDAEHELSSYRHSLHERLDAATGELIARYRDEPALALQALPLQQRSA
jgi:anti-sigma-K factor RsiG